MTTKVEFRVYSSGKGRRKRIFSTKSGAMVNARRLNAAIQRPRHCSHSHTRLDCPWQPHKIISTSPARRPYQRNTN
jgi:hypothetical protein